MKLTVKELMQVLKSCDGDTVVRFASQPRHPMEYSITSWCVIFDEDDKSTLYLAEGNQIGYLRSDVREQLGW